MKYIDAIRLKAKLDEHYRNYQSKYMETRNPYTQGLIDALDLAEQMIDSLQQEQPSEDLEQAAEEYSEKHGFRVPYDGSNNFYDDVDVQASKDGFVAGANWQKEQKPAWSEEDEEMLEYIMDDVNDATQLYATKEAKVMADKEIAWLKSLREKFKEY